jgi:hypothetical protein
MLDEPASLTATLWKSKASAFDYGPPEHDQLCPGETACHIDVVRSAADDLFDFIGQKPACQKTGIVMDGLLQPALWPVATSANGW